MLPICFVCYPHDDQELHCDRTVASTSLGRCETSSRPTPFTTLFCYSSYSALGRVILRFTSIRHVAMGFFANQQNGT